MSLRSWLIRIGATLAAVLALSVPAHALEFSVVDKTYTAPSDVYLFEIDQSGLYRIAFDTPSDFSFLGLSLWQPGGVLVGLAGGSGPFSSMLDLTFSAGQQLFALVRTPDPNASGTYNLSISLVPEPETWAMMVAGLGLIGFKLWRRLKARDLGMALRA